jgi:hypothetical protein
MNASGASLDRASVTIAAIDSEPLRWRLAYDVANGSAADIWLVDDGELAFSREGDRIELSYAREPLRPGTSVFGYFAPRTRRIAAGATERVAVELQWPLPLSDLWNPEHRAELPAGRYEVVVAVGVAASPDPPEPKLGDAVETPVLQWQRKIVSPPTMVTQG